VRTKSETRRQAILDTAAEAFRERGYDATSMSEVAARLGGSKATLYNYFCSKEALFAAVMVEQVRAQAAPVLDAFETADDFEAALRRLAPAYIRLMLRPEVLAVKRMSAAEGERCGFGPALYEEGPKPAWVRMAARVEKAMDEGVLRRDDPMRVFLHMKGLLESEFLEPCLQGWRGRPTDAEIEAAAASAVETFLRAYKA
jgi:AcrR family transcriptional regulator